MQIAFLILILFTSCSKSQVTTNALIHEASPYLLQHAHNPVDWLPWGDVAFEKARQEDKPVFLSIGYASCHWCHVMAHESFEDSAIAAFINEHFVAVKVDREERPEVDHHYMQAVQRITGSGGWPLSVFLTADRKPFYGGTYWPPEARYGRPGFMDVLRGLAKAWETERDSVMDSSSRLHDAVHGEVEMPPAEGQLSPALLENAVRASEGNFDPVHGGFLRAPKFPHAMELAMLLRYYSRTGNDTVRHMIEFTLDKMARGGIFDQIGGGFHRYSTDDTWLVPHFEKMLYDNALLMQVFTDAETLDPGFGRVAEHVYEWANREMKVTGGGYASSYDADSEGKEGVFYVWTPQEIAAVLPEYADAFSQRFNITEGGNFEDGKSIPNLTFGVDATPPISREQITAAKQLLLESRAKRIAPARDDKVLCDWNGLMISALTHAGHSGDAKQAAQRFLDPYLRDGELVHSFLGDKELRVQLLLDYAALGNGCVELFLATGEVSWFDAAYKLADDIERRFAKGDGLYYMSEESVAGVRSLDLYDSALPAGNSLAGNLCIKLYYLTGEEKFRQRAEKQINTLMPYLERAPTAFSQALLTAEWLMFPPEQVIVVFPMGVKKSQLPNHNRQILNIEEGFAEQLSANHPLRSFVDGKALLDNKTTYYVCKNFACELPSNDMLAVQESLKKPWQK